MKNKTTLFLLLAVIGIGFLLLLDNRKDYSSGINHIEEARTIYHLNCTLCHGSDGKGNGDTAKALPVTPPDWSNPKWQSSVTNEGIKNAIVGGGTSVGRSGFMPPYPEYADTTALEGFVALVREFGRRQ